MIKDKIFEEKKNLGIEEYEIIEGVKTPKHANIILGDLRCYLGKQDNLEFTHATLKKDYKYMMIKFHNKKDYEFCLDLKFFDYRDAHTRIVKHLDKEELESKQGPK